MNRRIAFKNMDHSAPIEEHAIKQLAKVEKFLEHERTPIYIDLVLEPSKTREHHKIELRVKSPHYNLVSHHEFRGDGFYEAMDKVIDTMYDELREHKRKNIDLEKQRGRHDDFKKQR